MIPAVDEHEAAYNSPVTEEANGKRYRIRQLTGEQIGTLNAYLRKTVRSPIQEFLYVNGVERYEDLGDDLTPQEAAEADRLHRQCLRTSQNWRPPTALSNEGAIIFTREEDAGREFLRVLFSTVKEIDDEEAEDIRKSFRINEMLALYSYAMGFDQSDPKASKEVVLPRSPK